MPPILAQENSKSSKKVEHLQHCPKGVMGRLHMGWMLLHVGLPTSLSALSSSLGLLSRWEQHQVYQTKN